MRRGAIGTFAAVILALVTAGPALAGAPPRTLTGDEIARLVRDRMGRDGGRNVFELVTGVLQDAGDNVDIPGGDLRRALQAAGIDVDDGIVAALLGNVTSIHRRGDQLSLVNAQATTQTLRDAATGREQGRISLDREVRMRMRGRGQGLRLDEVSGIKVGKAGGDLYPLRWMRLKDAPADRPVMQVNAGGAVFNGTVEFPLRVLEPPRAAQPPAAPAPPPALPLPPLEAAPLPTPEKLPGPDVVATAPPVPMDGRPQAGLGPEFGSERHRRQIEWIRRGAELNQADTEGIVSVLERVSRDAGKPAQKEK